MDFTYSNYCFSSNYFNKNDVVNLQGITDEKLHDFIERFDMAILGITSGEVLPESSFDLVNPLINGN